MYVHNNLFDYRRSFLLPEEIRSHATQFSHFKIYAQFEMEYFSLCNFQTNHACNKCDQTLSLYIHTGMTFIVPVRNCVNTKRFPPYIFKFVIFAIFAIFAHGCFQLARKILVTFAIFAIFAVILGPLFASLLSKSGILLHLLFLRFLRYLSWVF